MNPTLSQLECEILQYAMESLESFSTDFKWTSKLSVAKAMVNKTLQQVPRDWYIDFDSTVEFPPRLSYKKSNIKTLQLFRTFSEKGPVIMTWSNSPSKVDFKSSLEIDKWSKRSSKKIIKASLFSGRSDQKVMVLLPSTIKELDVCLVPYIHPIL